MAGAGLVHPTRQDYRRLPGATDEHYEKRKIILNEKLGKLCHATNHSKKAAINFLLRTTRPFHNESAVKDFFRIVLSYRPDYRPVKYGGSEPVKEIFDKNYLEKTVITWLVGNDCTCAIYDRKKELFPEFPIRELFGKYLPKEL